MYNKLVMVHFAHQHFLNEHYLTLQSQHFIKIKTLEHLLKRFAVLASNNTNDSVIHHALKHPQRCRRKSTSRQAQGCNTDSAYIHFADFSVLNDVLTLITSRNRFTCNLVPSYLIVRQS